MRATRNPRAFVLLPAFLAILIAIFLLRLTPTAECAMTPVTLPDNETLFAEVAHTPASRSQGLANRDSLPPNQGMLFVFPKEDTLSFWMKDTRIPLDIIWIRDNTVVDIHTLEAEDGDSIPQYTPARAADAVLEMNKGIAAQHRIAIGQQITWEACHEPAV